MLLATACASNGLAGEELKPWHLKAAYEIFDVRQKVTGTGVFEEWWAAKDKWKRSYTGSHFTGVEYHLPHTIVHEGGDVPWPESLIATKLVEPLGRQSKAEDSGAGTTAPGKLTPVPMVIRPLSVTKPPLLCVEPASQPGPLSFDDSLGYCFLANSAALRLSVVSAIETTYNKVGQFQDHFIGLESSVGVNQHGLLKLTVESLTSLPSSDDAFFTPSPDSASAERTHSPIHVDSQVIARHKLSGSSPSYPQFSKQNREQGVVILGATINEEGQIQDAQLLEAPSPALGSASLQAVRTWRYEPYLLNGSPVKVQTTVSVIFRLSR